MSSSKQSDLEREFAADIYLFEVPSPPRFLSLGWSSNFLRFESGQIHNVKYLQYMPYNQKPTPLLYTVPVLIHTGKPVWIDDLGTRN